MEYHNLATADQKLQDVPRLMENSEVWMARNGFACFGTNEFVLLITRMARLSGLSSGLVVLYEETDQGAEVLDVSEFGISGGRCHEWSE